HAGDWAGLRDQKGVNPYDFAVCVHQRPTGVARVDGRVGLDELAGLARVVTVGVGTVQRADDAARHRETEVERIAEGQNGLSGLERRGVAPGQAGEIAAAGL